MSERHRARAGTPDSGDEQAPLPDVDVWLVDAFNALHAVVLGGEARERFWDRRGRGRLLERLARGVPSGAPIVAVFDGTRPVEGDEAHPAAGLEVVFAPSADDWIVRRVRDHAAETPQGRAAPRHPVGVVSNDRKVVGRCRHHGAAIVAPGRFLAALRPAEAAPESERGGEPDDG